MMLKAKLFGTPTLEIGGETLEVGGKTLGLLYVLLLYPQSRASATALMWGDDGAQSLRQALVVLRKLPHAKDWLSDSELLSIHADTDVLRFEAAIAAGDSARAIELYTGTLLEGVQLKSGAFMEWLNAQRSHFEQSLAVALRLEIARLAQSHALLALGYADRLLQIDPLDELALQTALRLELQLGRREAALGRLNQFRRQLKTELGSEPLPETLELLGQNNLAQRYARARALAPEQSDTVFWAEVLGVAALDLAEVQPTSPDGEVSEPLRLVLHTQIAHTLEKRFDQTHPQAHTQAAQIARHFLKALEPRAALPWWLHSGQLAQKATQLPAASAAFFAALWITEDEPLRRDSLIALGNIAEATNDMALMHSIALEMQRVGAYLQDDLALFHANHRLAGWAIRSAQIGLATKAAQEALRIANRLSEPELQASAQGILGNIYMAQGQLVPARDALLLARASQNPPMQLRVYANLGSVFGMLGQLDESLFNLESALTIARALQNIPLVSMILFNLGATAEKLGKLQKAEWGFRETIDIATRIGNATMVLQATLALAQIHAARGHWGESFNTAQEALELAQTSPLLPQVQLHLGELETRFSRFDAAQEYFELARVGFTKTGNQRLLFAVEASLALLRARFGGNNNTANIQAALEALDTAGHQDLLQQAKLEYALLASQPKQVAWALEGLDASRLSVRVARARLARLQKQNPEPDLESALETALEQEIYLDVALGFELLGNKNRAQEAKISSAAGLPKAQRKAFIS